MIEEKKVREIVEEYLQGTPYFLVEVTVGTDNVIVVEVDSEESVPIDFCVELSRHIESLLDRDVEDYELEVGSAGLTSPFKVLRQYKKHEGEEVEVQIEKGPKYVGTLTNITDDAFGLEIRKMVKKEGAKKKVEEMETLSIPYNQVKYTKCTITFK